MTRPPWEILIGNRDTLDYLATKFQRNTKPHPLQELVEEALNCMLTEDEEEVYYLRYGEGLSIRAIARALGYTSHQVIQVKLQRIHDKIGEYIGQNRSTITSSD